jgi:hypothetical protein
MLYGVVCGATGKLLRRPARNVHGIHTLRRVLAIKLYAATGFGGGVRHRVSSSNSSSNIRLRRE